ncbi:hypothetical protein CAPTEDRAFT_207087 [Capitella teleta]|uniref:Sugar phosphate transporter domain-containing protein n=1 Tax=Capitella teleta TaxID=283909 RepID=R7VL92_CAPTE|nr:hypothetical protein CAPTEDRAFT_207087 [Capitella teleta]|eukprot:ELU17420.1 hypothetical protein CAPTEDRAFT_207087 [Capitella teleta]
MVTEAVLAACDQNHLSKPKSLECRDTSAMVPCSGEQISNIRNTSVYIALYVATLFVNKYVLSVLNFTYPTIFQGWQSLVGAILLRMLIGTGKINVEIAQISSLHPKFQFLQLLSELERVYLNYIYSFAVLLPCTYFLGDAIQAQHFQFWYYYKFYISCVLSGVFGVLLIISQNYIQHTSPSPQKTSLSDINALAKIVAAGISILVFAFTPTALNIPWIFVNLCTGMLLKQSEFELPNDPSLTSEERMEESNV